MPKSKPPPGDELEPTGQPGQPPAGDGDLPDPALGNVALSADYVRQSPEYRELQRQNRILARQSGDAQREAARVRAEAEQRAQAAEAQRAEEQAARVRTILGDDGVAIWDQFADLSTTDPVGAAEFLAQQLQGRAQNPAPAAGDPTPPPAGGTPVPQPGNAPAAAGLSRAVGDAPLAGQADETDQVIAGLEATYADIAERNQDPARRNRVTMRDRANGFIAYLGAAYLKSGARPKS